MNREPVCVVLLPVRATILRRFLRDCFDDAARPEEVLDFDAQGLTRAVLEDVLKQVEDDLMRPCIECTRKHFEDEGLVIRERILELMATMKPDDERWVRCDIVNQTVTGTDPTVNYALKCGHWVIDL